MFNDNDLFLLAARALESALISVRVVGRLKANNPHSPTAFWAPWPFKRRSWLIQTQERGTAAPSHSYGNYWPKVLIAGSKICLRLCFPETRRCLKPVLMGWGAGPYAVHTMDKTSGM